VAARIVVSRAIWKGNRGIRTGVVSGADPEAEHPDLFAAGFPRRWGAWPAVSAEPGLAYAGEAPAVVRRRGRSTDVGQRTTVKRTDAAT
jgi:hypothetical protein